MFIPLNDDNPLVSIRFQYVTILLITVNSLIHLGRYAGFPDSQVISFIFIPSELFGPATGTLIPGYPANQPLFPESLTLVTHQFLHSDIFHLVGNMVFLWVFGDNVEDAMGHFKFLIFYLACGAAGALMHGMILDNPLIGASGAGSGVIAAYLMLHPRVHVWVLALNWIPVRVTAAAALGIWVLFQIFMAVQDQNGDVAWWAHIGGLLAGAVLVLLMRKPSVPLFDRFEDSK